MVLWGITTYFNPCGYKKRYKNYLAFRQASKKQNLKLITVELAVGGSPFVLKQSFADILVQVRSKSVLWHKEQLLNIALTKLPPDCDKICWVDCDLIFENGGWVNELSAKLDEHVVFVQPFEMVTNLTENKSVGHTTLAYTNPGKNGTNSKGTVGFGWAAKLDFIKSIGGFYAYNIIGGGDNFVQSIMKASHFIKKSKNGIDELLSSQEMTRFNDEHKKHYINYLRTLANLDVDLIDKKCVSFISGNVFHLWHGSTQDRQYAARHDILKKHKFNPSLHIKVNNDNCLEWSDSAPKVLRQSVKKYFDLRKEDGNK